jgi:hypothetical protein
MHRKKRVFVFGLHELGPIHLQLPGRVSLGKVDQQLVSGLD